MVALGGSTSLGVILVIFLGMQGSNRYQAAKERFDAATEEASGSEKSALYPQASNRDGKDKALREYRKSVEALQAAFEPFLPKEIKNVTPQEFTTRLLATNLEIRKAFENVGAVIPEGFFVGFESYKTSLAPGKATGILDYQLDSIKNLLIALAKSQPTALQNLHRPNLPEEESKSYTPADTAAARALPLELTFSGSERSVREFFSALSKLENQYVIIRSLRIGNEKKDPPLVGDAKFDNPTVGLPATDAFGGGFTLATNTASAAVIKPVVSAVDSSRILFQVLGHEQVEVFVRLDLFEFLPAKKLL